MGLPLLCAYDMTRMQMKREAASGVSAGVSAAPEGPT